MNTRSILTSMITVFFLFVVGCTNRYGTIEYEHVPDINNKNVSAAPVLPSRVVSETYDEGGIVRKPQWDWAEEKKFSDTVSTAAWNSYYSEELKNIPSGWNWNQCLDWSRPTSFPAWVWFNGTNMGLGSDTLWILLPNMLDSCQNIKSDYIIVPAFNALYPTLVQVYNNGSRSEFLKPTASFGSGLWDVKGRNWIKIQGTHMYLDDMKGDRDAVIHEFQTVSMSAMPMTKAIQKQRTEFERKMHSRVELIGSVKLGLVPSVSYEGVMSADSAAYNEITAGFGLRYVRGRWGGEVRWNPIIRSSATKVEQEFYKGSSYMAGILYYPGLIINTKAGNEGVWARFGLAGGFVYEKYDKWADANELNGLNSNSTGPDALFGGYLAPSAGIGNLLQFEVGLPLIFTGNSKGTKFTIGLDFNAGIGF